LYGSIGPAVAPPPTRDRRRALSAGFDIHLVKPVDPQKLLGYLV